MPFKDTDKYLEECIQSILNQSHENWELIAINDHSTDNSYPIVESFAERDKRIRLFNNPGEGIIAALNYAFELSKGEFITRIDSDDKVPTTRLEEHLNLLEKAGKGYIATSKIEYFSDKPIGPGYLQYQKWLNSLVDNNSHWENIYRECVIASPNWMMHKEDLEQCGAFEGEDYPEDYDLVFRIREQNIKVVSCPKTTLLWREHSKRISRNDERLTDWYFSKLKVKFFLRNDYQTNKTLVIWGVGNRAKDLVKLFDDHQIPILWLSANPNKIGKQIDGHTIVGLNAISNNDMLQHIITFTNQESQKKVVQYMKKEGLNLNEDYSFFAM